MDDIYEHIGYSKAIIGAAFIQYFMYSFVYIMEGGKYGELHGEKQNAQGANA